jgi:hypothetical protein
MNNQRFSGRSRCQIAEKPQMENILDKESVRRPGGKNTMSIWSNGRAIQWKMPAGRLKQRYRSMDIPCRSSWTGAHEIFQAREYDAGASNSSSEPARKRKTAGRRPTQILKNTLKLLRKH